MAAECPSHLSQITTLWSVVCRAHVGEEADRQAARQALLERYGGAVYRYLRKSVRDADAAQELTQDFALRFIRGDFQRADPARGRFRSFVKTALYHLIVDYRRKQAGQPRPLDSQAPEPAAPEGEPHDLETEFRRAWREELFQRTWQRLNAVGERSRQPLHAVLRLKAEQPHLKAPELAEQLGKQLGQSLTPESVRQTLHRARLLFAELLLEQVSQSLAEPSLEALTEELAELELLEYCRPALKK